VPLKSGAEIERVRGVLVLDAVTAEKTVLVSF
jgi:hypothetical protein